MLGHNKLRVRKVAGMEACAWLGTNVKTFDTDMQSLPFSMGSSANPVLLTVQN